MKGESIPGAAMVLLPPAPDVCQTCGTKHPPEFPHNQQSLYYQVAFHMANGCGPTWDDAMAHCSTDMKAEWTIALASMIAEQKAQREVAS